MKATLYLFSTCLLSALAFTSVSRSGSALAQPSAQPGVTKNNAGDVYLSERVQYVRDNRANKITQEQREVAAARLKARQANYSTNR